VTKSTANIITGRRTKWVVLLFWIAVAVAAGPLAGKLTGVEKNDAKSWLPQTAESTKVLDVMTSFSDPNTIPAVVVYERPGGITPADKAAVAADVRAYSARPELDGEVTGPVPSADGRALQVVVPLNLGKDGWNKASGVVKDLRAVAKDGADGMQTHVTGPAGQAADSSEAFSGIDGRLLYGTIIVVIAILLVTYRSPVLWLLPVLSAGLALTSAQAVVYLLAEHAGLTVNAQSAGILTVLIFGAGTDYALLLVARYREELRRHADRHEAMAVALHRAGPAIIASAATVAVGMLCLLFAEMNSTKGLGPVLAVGIVVGLFAMLTLLPALLVIVGRWIFWPVRPRHGTVEPSAAGLWARTGGRIARRPRTTWVVTSLVLGVMAIGIVQLNPNGLANKDAFRGNPDSVVGAEVQARHFPAGAGSPVVVVSDAAAGPASVEAVRTALAGTSGIDPASVTKPATVGGHAYLEGTLDAAPDSQAAFATVDRVRDAVHAVPGANAMVGGNSAVNLDIERASDRDGNVIMPIVLVVVFVILGLLLRALVAPVVLIATVVASFGAAMGVSALVFRHVFGFPGTDAGFPLFVFVFLVALGIDYNIFLMTRVREEVAHSHDGDPRRAAITGLAATGGVITSAGLVLAGTFAVLATLPATAFAEIGFAVAFGVLLDTIVVRSILVTALNLDLGRWMWWPSRVARRTAPAPTVATSATVPGEERRESAGISPQ
jgi:putative drug exporter of the RND superfamily